jgi:DeoR family glycerol-3-phosphate regulon repressor
MKPKQRQARIAEIIGQQGLASVEVLAADFDVSAETIRRDLARLAESGVVQKVHGGAKRLRLHSEGSFQQRMTENADAKQVIARKLAELVEPGDTLFIDTGSTTLTCAETLATIGGLTVITNSIHIAQAFSATDAGNSVYLLGGTFSGDNGQTVGPLVLEQIGGFQADHAILTVAALDGEVGAMDSNFDEARVARAMIDNARHVFVVANATKFQRKAAFKVCPLGMIDALVSDQEPEADLAAALLEAGVEVR